MSQTGIQKDSDQVILEREAYGLRVIVYARILLQALMIPGAFLSSNGLFEVIGVTLLCSIILAFCIYALIQVKRLKQLMFIGIAGVFLDVLWLGALSVVWYISVGGPWIPVSFLLKNDLPFVAILIILINSLSFRPLYPLLAGGGVLLVHFTIVLFAIFDDRTLYSDNLLEVFMGPAISLGLELSGPPSFMVLFAVLLWYLNRLGRKTIHEARQLEQDNLGMTQKMLHVVEENNRTLEKRVEARTSELERLSKKLAKYLSPQVYNSIFSGKQDVKLESYRKKLTVFFSDIQGFTETTDSMESESLTALLNDYLNEMSQIALRYGGTIDKYMGDAIMVFFGDPETRGEREDALACVCMALAMRERMKALRQKWYRQGVAMPLHIRMGINTGYCTVGNFGSEDRLDYTIIGGQVNLASRLESHAVTDQILISHETFALVRENVTCETKGSIKVKGISHPIQTYQVIDSHEGALADSQVFNEETDGFSMVMDLEKISETDREKVRETLEQALTKMAQK